MSVLLLFSSGGQLLGVKAFFFFYLPFEEFLFICLLFEFWGEGWGMRYKVKGDEPLIFPQWIIRIIYNLPLLIISFCS